MHASFLNIGKHRLHTFRTGEPSPATGSGHLASVFREPLRVDRSRGDLGRRRYRGGEADGGHGGGEHEGRGQHQDADVVERHVCEVLLVGDHFTDGADLGLVVHNLTDNLILLLVH